MSRAISISFARDVTSRARVVTTTSRARVCARMARARARTASARATTTGDDARERERATHAITRRAIACVVASLSATMVTTKASRAEVVPEFLEETLDIIARCRAIMRGESTDDASLDEFQDKRRAWFAKYQYKHGKSFYGYANTWNAQAKIGVQIAVNRENGEAYDANHTVYNRDYLLKILDKAEDELRDMAKRDAF